MSDHNQHTRNPGFKPGDNWAECQRCGFDIYGSKLKKEWTGLLVCEKCWEPRHPQDFVRARKEDTSPQELHTGNISAGEDTINLQDNTSPTLNYGVDKAEQDWNTALTANRTITLAASTLDYVQFTIYRSGGGAFTLDVGGIYTVPANLNRAVVVQFYGSAWHVMDSYPI